MRGKLVLIFLMLSFAFCSCEKEYAGYDTAPEFTPECFATFVKTVDSLQELKTDSVITAARFNIEKQKALSILFNCKK